MEVDVHGQHQPDDGAHEQGTRPNMPAGQTADDDEQPSQIIGGAEQGPSQITGAHEKQGGGAEEPEYVAQHPNIEKTVQKFRHIKAGIYPGDRDAFPVSLDSQVYDLTGLNVLKKNNALVFVESGEGDGANMVDNVVNFKAAGAIALIREDDDNFPTRWVHVKARVGSSEKNPVCKQDKKAEHE